MSSSKDSHRQREYLRTVYEPNAEAGLPRHLIDIVFVHGLNPLSKADFANATWTHENGNFWPSQQLPRHIPSARILIFSYNSQVAWDTNKDGIHEHASNLLDRLSGARKLKHADENYNIPIIFVAHSLGGLVVKQALVIAKNDDNYINLKKSTHGLVFFAVPHQGGNGAGLGAIAKNIVLSLTGDANNDMIETLKSNSLFQETQAVFFKHQLEDYRIVSVYENRPTKLKGFLGKATSLVIVDRKSATLGLTGAREKLLTVNSNHSEVCRFEDDDDKFDPVKRAIEALADDAMAEQKRMATDRSRVDLQAQERNVHWIVPKNTNTLFIGRNDILEKLDRSLGPQSNSLQMSKHQKRFVIYGDGGIGKSEVCLKFANDHRQHFWGIFWIDASSRETARDAFIKVGKLCGANAESFEDVKTWLANTRHSWLLIIDNADNPKIDYAAYFPSGSRGNIILTTRNPQCHVHATVNSEGLDPLDIRDAKSLLFKAAGMTGSLRENNRNAAENLVQGLGFHTLAIIQAGAFIKYHHFSLKQYFTLFKTQEKQILQYRLTQEESTYGSVFATFEISATQMQSSQDQSAADALSLLQILGFFHFQEIPESMFSRARDEAIFIRKQVNRGRPVNEIYPLSELQTARLPLFMMQQNETALNLFLPWRETLNLLESYSLIKISGNGEDFSFSMHPLVHTWTRIRHELPSRKEGWRAAGSIIALSMRGIEYDIFYEKLQSHVGAYLDHPISEYIIDMSKLEISQTHYHICYLLLHLRETSRIRQLLNVHDTFKAWASATGTSSLRIQCLTAECLIQEKQPKAAVELLERVLGTKHLDDFYGQLVLAKACMASKQHQKAISLLEPILEVREEIVKAENVHLLSSYYELGKAYVGNRQFEKAITILKHVVEINEKTMVPAHLNRLASQFKLEIAYIHTYEYEKAAKIFQHVLEIQRAILDVEDIRLLQTQYQLARAYIGMGNGHYDKAAELLEQVVGIHERILEPDDPWLVKLQRKLEGVNKCIEVEKSNKSDSASGEGA